MQWLMLQQETPRDYVTAIAEQRSMRNFINLSAQMLDMPPHCTGESMEEHAVDAWGRTVVSIDPAYFRPTGVQTLLGDPSKARRELGWELQTSFEELVREMVDADLRQRGAMR